MKIIVLEGGVGAGKTTTSNILKKTLGLRQDILYLPEPKFTEHTIQGITYNPLELLYSGETEKQYFAIQLVIQQRLADFYQAVSLNNVKIIILDRWIPSCKIFLTMGYKKGLLTKFSYDVLAENVDRLQRKFLSKIKRHTGSEEIITKVYYLNTSPEQCVKNIRQRGRPEEMPCSQTFWLDLNNDFERVAMTNWKKYHLISNREDIIKSILFTCQTELSLDFPGIIEFGKCKEDAIFPVCSTERSVGYDLHSIENVTINPGCVKKIQTGIKIKYMNGNFYPQILSRSGLGTKKCTAICGTIDPDYIGEELLVLLLNNSLEESINITKGDKIAQIVFLKYAKPFSFSMKLLKKKRIGGFGSTGGTPNKKLDLLADKKDE